MRRDLAVLGVLGLFLGVSRAFAPPHCATVVDLWGSTQSSSSRRSHWLAITSYSQSSSTWVPFYLSHRLKPGNPGAGIVWTTLLNPGSGPLVFGRNWDGTRVWALDATGPHCVYRARSTPDFSGQLQGIDGYTKNSVVGVDGQGAIYEVRANGNSTMVAQPGWINPPLDPEDDFITSFFTVGPDRVGIISVNRLFVVDFDPAKGKVVSHVAIDHHIAHISDETQAVGDATGFWITGNVKPSPTGVNPGPDHLFYFPLLAGGQIGKRRDFPLASQGLGMMDMGPSGDLLGVEGNDLFSVSATTGQMGLLEANAFPFLTIRSQRLQAAGLVPRVSNRNSMATLLLPRSIFNLTGSQAAQSTPQALKPTLHANPSTENEYHELLLYELDRNFSYTVRGQTMPSAVTVDAIATAANVVQQTLSHFQQVPPTELSKLGLRYDRGFLVVMPGHNGNVVALSDVAYMLKHRAARP